MVTAKTQYSLSNARRYFSEHLAIGDYYREGQRIAGEWFGAGAQALGLGGQIREADFLALCENRHPKLSTTLTQRTNSVRKAGGMLESNRRIFYDFTFSPPKSVSLVALVAGDVRIQGAHDRAVRIALGELEAFAATRVRRGGANASRLTGNLVAALFNHDTSRALDPHVHTHCIAFNATFDHAEGKWKALQNHQLLCARKYAEAVYYHELARDLAAVGYRIRNKARGDFELEGVSPELIHQFSKRHEQIDKSLNALLHEKPHLATVNLKELRERLATAERFRKIRNQAPEELRQRWEAQLAPGELATLRALRCDTGQGVPEFKREVVAREAVDWAEEHLFDRRSTVNEHEIWQAAIEHVRGRNVSASDLRHETAGRGYIRKAGESNVVTLRVVLEREWAIVEAGRKGIGEFPAFVQEPPTFQESVSEEQRRALRRLLGSRDFITLFRGGAGTGKTFVLQRLAQSLESAGHRVVMLASQRQQVVDLGKSGFREPATVSQFLTGPSIPPNAIVIVDEAGQVGGRQLLDLIREVADHSGRLILSGDTRQHGPVEASDALLALERYADLRPAELETIRRQDPRLGRGEAETRQIRVYRAAVKAAADGSMAESFDRLDQLGAIVACGLGGQQQRLADEYVRLTEQGLTSVVVAQTWSEVHRVNESVREVLKRRGILGEMDYALTALERIDVTTAEKADPRTHESDHVAVFNRPLRGFDAGARGRLAGVVKRGVLVAIQGRIILVNKRHLDRITICRPLTMKVAPGDRLQIRANRRMANGDRINNGELVTVRSVAANGSIHLADNRMIDPEFREFLPGYAVTSYGSQGKTVDHVLFSDSAVRAATDRRQWYVTISRGRRGIRIFTPDKRQLRQSVVRCGDQPLALDLVPTNVAEAIGRKWAMAPWKRWLKPWSDRAQVFLARAMCKSVNARTQRQVHERQVA